MNARRTLATSLSIGAIAVLGVGSLSAADAKAAGVTQQTLRPVASAAYNPAALPVPADRTIRLQVDETGTVHPVG